MNRLILFSLPACFLSFVSTLSATSFLSSLSPGNPPMSCNTSINVALSENCEAAPTLPAFLADDTYTIHTIVEVDRVAPLGNGPWTPAVFGPPDAGKTYRFRVRDTLDGASCTGEITLQDVTPPVLHCAEDVTVSAFMKSNWAPAFLQDTLGFLNVFATAFDACMGPVPVTYKDSLQKYPCDAPSPRIILRTWKAVDQFGNYSTCKQRIYVRNLTFDQIIFPADTTAVCSAVHGTSPSVTGKPYVVANGHAFPANAGWGGLSTGYSDSLSGECSAYLYRKWLAIEWCTATVVEHVQIIDISDPGPTFLECPNTFFVNIFAENCFSSIQLPDFKVIQPCSGIVSASVAWEQAFTGDTTVLTTWTNVVGEGSPHTVSPGTVSGFPAGISTVRYEVTDACGNTASCSFIIAATDTSGLCAAPDILCRVRTETLLPVGDVSVQLTVPSGPTTVTQVTGAAGTAIFDSPPAGAEFNLTLFRNNLVLSGVTTYDLILISRHILGLQALNSPYKLIAADASRNGVISVFDIATIRSIILGITTQYPDNTSWRFLPSGFTFANPANPFAEPFPENASYVAPVYSPIDFTGIKIGDVDNSVIPLGYPVGEERRLRTLFFETDNRSVRTGEECTVSFTSREAPEGFQFTLHTGDLDILEILPGAHLRPEHFGLFPAQNTLTVACEAGGAARFALRLKSRRTGELQDMLKIGSGITPAEAYLSTVTGQLETASVALRFSNGSQDFRLHQNRPNPATGFTDIGFYLPADSDVTLRVFDPAGRVVYSKTSTYEKGEQTERIDLNGVAPGVLYYQVQTGEHYAIRKMMRL